MSRNKSAGEPKHGVLGQSQACFHGKGGYNEKASPFGSKAGTNNTTAAASPRFGVSGQRLSGGDKAGKATGYPPGYTSR